MTLLQGLQGLSRGPWSHQVMKAAAVSEKKFLHCHNRDEPVWVFLKEMLFRCRDVLVPDAERPGIRYYVVIQCFFPEIEGFAIGMPYEGFPFG